MSEEATTRHLRLSEMSKAAEQVRANYYDKSWALVIGINDYQGEHPMLAWDTLSDSFKRNTSGLNRDTYLADCARTTVQVTNILDLDTRTESVVEVRGQCALVRIQFIYSGPQEMTFGLIQSDSINSPWQIQVVRPDHTEAQARADDVCF